MDAKKPRPPRRKRATPERSKQPLNLSLDAEVKLLIQIHADYRGHTCSEVVEDLARNHLREVYLVRRSLAVAGQGSPEVDAA